MSNEKLQRPARRIPYVNNKKIGILANGRDNAELLARETARFYVERHQCSVVDFYDKKEASQPCSLAQLKLMSESCDFLITAVGDCESSSSCSLRDAISFEKYAKPALVICTRPYESIAKNVAAEMGIPAYPFVLVNHPVESRTPEEITQRALGAYRNGMAVLTGAYLIRG